MKIVLDTNIRKKNQIKHIIWYIITYYNILGILLRTMIYQLLNDIGGRDRMAVGSATTYAIYAYLH
jgi:hypothetical protein